MHTRTRGAAVVAALALALAAPAPVHARVREPFTGVPAPTEAQLQNDMRFRGELGLRADRAYVKKLFDDARSGVVQASTGAGAILTSAEDATVRARTDAVDHVVDVADDYFKTRRDVYAGMWIDQGLGLVGIGVTQDKAAVERDLSLLIGPTSAVWHIETKPVSLDSLYELQRSIDLAASDLRARSVDISSTSIDEEQNKVYVGAASDTTTARQTLETKFSGAPIVVEYEARPTFDGVGDTNSPPFRGGQEIKRNAERPGYVYRCTSAFVAYQIERLDAAIFNTTYFLTSAGHCEKAAGTGTTGALWLQGTNPVGPSERNAFKNGTAADGLAISFSSQFRSNEVAVSGTDNRAIKCMMTTDVKQGQVEIISGARTGGYQTGRLVRTNGTVNYTDDSSGVTVTLVKQNVTDYFSQSGDSGASVFGTRECRYRAQGVHSGSSVGGSKPLRYYSPIFQVTKALGLAGIELA
jgi:hypothetical protein